MRALTVGGAAAAVIVGAITFAAGTWAFTAVLLAFFVSSVLLSRLGRARKRATLIDVGKQGPRDAAQVLANGGVATVCALLYGLTGDHRLAFAFVGAYAAATADTWATEIGTLVGGRPRSILTLRPLATGISGGITLVGTLAEIAGAWWLGTIGVLALLFLLRIVPFEARPTPLPDGSYLIFVPAYPLWRSYLAFGAFYGIAGVIGALVDSVLGASAQELRRCPACERTCETDPHVCGSPTRRVRGLPGVTNDLVNAVATLAGAVVAAALY